MREGTRSERCEAAQIEDRMSPSPVAGRPASHPRRIVSRLLLAFLAVLPCGTAGTSSVPGTPLEDGLTLEREIQSGETHVYPVEIEAGQFLRVLVQEDGVDLVLRLFDPKGVPVLVADSWRRGRAEALEDLSALADSSGSYRFEVTAGKEGSSRYSLRVEGPRSPGREDEQRAEAVQATWRGLIDPPKKDVEAQIRWLETAFMLWQGLGETGKSAEAQFSLGRVKSSSSLRAHGPAALHYQQAAGLWSRWPHPAAKLLQANALTNLGRCLRHTDRREEARKAHEQALTLACEAGDPDLQAENLDDLGLMEMEGGEIARRATFI